MSIWIAILLSLTLVFGFISFFLFMSSFDFRPELLRRISMHSSDERPMLNHLCRSLIDLIFVIDQLDCTLVDEILYPDEPHKVLNND